jgi:hypothetical protein
MMRYVQSFKRITTRREADHCLQKLRIFNMLGAFFTPTYRDWWLAYAQIPGDMSPYHNHWLVCRSAANAFAQGVV